jgi:dynein heavy chain 2, cytosolic
LVVQLGIADTGIDSIKDEIIFWNQKHAHATTKSDREAAESFSASLEQIHDRLKTDFGPATNLSELDDFTDFIHNALDEIWKLPYQYPQNRMVGVMKVISTYVVKFCVDHIQSVEIWKLNSLNVNSDIVEVTDVVDAWMQVCDSLTRLFWPHYGQHAWMGEAFVPQNGRLFKNRVEEIARMRDANKQVLALFAEDQTFMNMASRIFSTLENTNCFDTSPFGQKRWMNAKQKLEPAFEEIDDKISGKLQSQILGQLQNPRQVVHLFMKYKNVIQRPAIRQALLAEREHLMEATQTLLKDIKKTIADTNHDEESGSPVIAEARFLKIIDHEVSFQRKSCKIKK